MNDRTVIVIAHRLSTVRHADMIVVCGAQGHVVSRQEDTAVACLWR